MYGPNGFSITSGPSGNIRIPATIQFSEAAPVSSGTREYKVQARRTVGAGGGLTNRHMTIQVFAN